MGKIRNGSGSWFSLFNKDQYIEVETWQDFPRPLSSEASRSSSGVVSCLWAPWCGRQSGGPLVTWIHAFTFA